MKEKFFDINKNTVVQQNLRGLTNARNLCTIWIGIAAGIFGFDGLLGLAFYLAMDVVVGLMICARFGFQAEPRFTSLKKMMSQSLMANVMTYMVVWVLFHNLVYIL